MTKSKNRRAIINRRALSGEVVEVNIELETHPELINEDPYGKGWIARLRVSDPSEFAALMQADEYRAAVEGD